MSYSFISWVFLVFLSVLLSGLNASYAQTRADLYPSRAVKIVVPSPPGGGTDIVGRLLAQHLTADLGQSFFVENKAGAGNMIGINAVAKSPADGYTLLFVPSTLVLNTVLYKSISFDPIKDFSPISVAATVPNILIVNNNLPVSTLADYLNLAKSKNSNLSYGSAGIGTSPHMSMELLKSMANVQIQHIPYKGTAPAVADLLAGQVSGVFTNALEAMALITSGKVKALAVSGQKRIDTLPQVPTVQEAGVPKYLSTQWYGLLAPTGTAQESIDKLHASVVKGLKSKTIKDKLTQDGAEAVGSTPKEFAQLIKEELEKWTRVAKTQGIEPE
jgi:tripartite-type tricarboxylate transporter receptor subunit TctC